MNNSSRGIGLREIAGMVGCAPPAENVQITGIATLADAGPGDLSFLGSEAYLKQFKTTRAAAVLVQKKLQVPEIAGTIVLSVGRRGSGDGHGAGGIRAAGRSAEGGERSTSEN